MDAQSAKSVRLIAALDRLVDTESMLVRSGDFEEVAATQIRIGAVITALASLPRGVVDVGGLAPILERREESRREIERLAAELQSELMRVDSGRRRLREVAPVYAGQGAQGSRFSGEA